jgi:hypothetical protein
VFDGSYADLLPAHTTGDLIANFLSGSSSSQPNAVGNVLKDNGPTGSTLKAAEESLNADENNLANTSYVTVSQASILPPALQAVSNICGTSAAWTKVKITNTGGSMSAIQTPTPVTPTTAAPTPTAFVPQTLMNISGSGDTTTAQFTVGGSGDYDVIWSYNVGNDGPTVNFDFAGDGGSDFNLTGPDQLGTGGSGVTHVYGDAGTHYLTVLSEGDWTIKVVTAE